MKERPILMGAPMVRAILADAKTQTRRVVKPQPLGDKPRSAWFEPGVMGWAPSEIPSQAWHRVRCPYGQPGDRLWVRETFMDLQGTGVEHRDSAGNRQRYAYAADTRPGSYGDECRKDYGLKWRPSIHMPRTTSRITLEVTAVRVERLQDISEADAQAEGARANDPCDHTRYSCAEIGCSGPGDYRGGFKDTWESINGPGSWGANPWVWVVEFKRVTP